MKLISLAFPSIATSHTFQVPPLINTTQVLDAAASATAGFTRYAAPSTDGPPTLLLKEKHLRGLIAIALTSETPIITAHVTHAQILNAHWAYPTPSLSVPYPPNHLGLRLVLPAIKYGYGYHTETDQVPVWLSAGTYQFIYENQLLTDELLQAQTNTPSGGPNIIDQIVRPLEKAEADALIQIYNSQPFHPYFGPSLVA